jgi:hypothetical protein
VAATVGRVVDPPNSGLRELPNQALLASLSAKHGPSEGRAIFNDLRWLNDPDAPVSVPADGAIGKRQRPPAPNPAQLSGASQNPPETLDDAAAGILKSSGVPTGMGTYAQLVVLSDPMISSENILTLGRSGFIQLVPPDTPVLDLHFNDQLALYRNFQYKPMHLYRNTELQE